MLLITMSCHVFARVETIEKVEGVGAEQSEEDTGKHKVDVPHNPGSGNVHDDIKNTMKNAWDTIATIVQMLAVGCVVFAGVRYMLSSADQRADIKQGMIFLAVGAAIIFGATLIIRLVVSSFNSIVQ